MNPEDMLRMMGLEPQPFHEWVEVKVLSHKVCKKCGTIMNGKNNVEKCNHPQ